MIPIKADDVTRESMIQNVIDVFESATVEQESKGRAWYRTAHQTAEMIGDVRQGAALLAAFSPQTGWLLNIQLACDAYETGTPRGHVGDVLSKANKILAGIAPEDVLPMERKTGHFYRCIVDPCDPWAVCIDRHAHDLAVGEAYGDRERGLSAKGRYELLARVYREAAAKLGEVPSTVQAVTWVVWRESLAGTSTRGSSALLEV